MLIEALLPVFSILGLGMGVQYFLSDRLDFKLSKGDFFLTAVLVGEFLLILSMGLAGVLTKDGLWLVSRTYFMSATAISGVAIYHYVTHNIHRLETVRSPLPKKWTGEHILALLVGVFLLEYLFLLYLFPLRGFDAVERYFPDAFYYYQEDAIPTINALNVSPTFKPPAHTLLFTYVLYVSGRDAYHLIPFLTLLALVVVAYKFGEVFLGSSRRGWFSALLLLALPLTRELATVWAYYQDLYVAFYFAAGIYFFLLAFHHQNTGYSVISGFAVGLAILAKMSGWTLPFVLLLMAPVGKKGRIMKAIMLIIVASWLAMKAAAGIFVGVSVAIALVMFLLLLLIHVIPSDNASITRTALPLITGVFIGCWWMLRMIFVLPGSYDIFIHFYFQIQGSPRWEYPVHASQESILTLERLHSVSFLGTCLILLVSFWFATGWIVPKVLALLEARKSASFSVWCFTFLMIWFAYWFTGSIRYLSVVVVPVVLLTVIGIDSLHERLLKGKIPLLGLEATALALATFQIHHKILWHSWRGFSDRSKYVSYPFDVLLVFCGVFLAILAIFVIICSREGRSVGQFRLEKPRYDGLSLVSLAIAFLVLIAVTAPVEKEIGDLQGAGWDTQRLARQKVYEYRPTYQELVDAIIEEDLPDASIIGANVFGLEFFTQQPVIDLFWGGAPLVSTLFQKENVTEGINLLKRYSTRLIVSLKQSNPFYERFQAEIASQTYLFDVIRNNRYFHNVFSNEEFALYRLLTYSSFEGFIDLSFVTPEEKANILGELGYFRSGTRPSLVATIDLTNFKWASATCTVELTYATDLANHTVNRVLEFPITDGFLKINVFELPRQNCSLENLKLIFDLFDPTGTHLGIQAFQARPKGEGLLMNYDQARNIWFTTSNWGYEVV